MSRVLQKSDVVGNCVHDVLTGPPTIIPCDEIEPGWTLAIYPVLIEFFNGRLIELQRLEETGSGWALMSTERSREELVPALFPLNDEPGSDDTRQEIFGQRIIEVVEYPGWMSVGAVLSGGKVLHADCDSVVIPCWSGPVLDPRYEDDDPADFLTLWEGIPLPQFETIARPRPNRH